MKLCIAWESSHTPGGRETRLVELNDEGFYIVEYPKLGKREIIRSIDFRFEILFEVGCFAFLDAYYRETVSSFTAALERFYEFYLAVIARAYGLDATDYQRTWRYLKNSSERQFGAFLAVYTLTRQACPPVLSEEKDTMKSPR